MLEFLYWRNVKNIYFFSKFQIFLLSGLDWSMKCTMIYRFLFLNDYKKNSKFLCWMSQVGPFPTTLILNLHRKNSNDKSFSWISFLKSFYDFSKIFLLLISVKSFNQTIFFLNTDWSKSVPMFKSYKKFYRVIGKTFLRYSQICSDNSRNLGSETKKFHHMKIRKSPGRVIFLLGSINWSPC